MEFFENIGVANAAAFRGRTYDSTGVLKIFVLNTKMIVLAFLVLNGLFHISTTDITLSLKSGCFLNIKLILQKI